MIDITALRNAHKLGQADQFGREWTFENATATGALEHSMANEQQRYKQLRILNEYEAQLVAQASSAAKRSVNIVNLCVRVIWFLFTP